MAAFTDHLTVVLSIALDVDTIRRGTGYWKMNVALLQDSSFQRKLLLQWARWKLQRKYFPDMVMWWERVAKKQILLLLIREGTEKHKDDREMENIYLACLYDLLKDPTHEAMWAAKVNLSKAKLVKLYSIRLASRTIDLQTPDIFQEEQMSLFHLTKRRTRRVQRKIPEWRHTNVDERNNGHLQRLHETEIWTNLG